MTTSHLQIRDARDQLIDLLGLGDTLPLRDLEVRADNLTVPYDTRSKIPVALSQRGVTYELHDRDGRQVVRREPVSSGPERDVPVEADGNGGDAILETPKIKEDVTYRIFARKKRTEAYLLELATVKVGLDASLTARILAPLLDPTIEKPEDTDPRLVDYGDGLEVEVDRTQEGVDYKAVYRKPAPERNPPFEEIDLSDEVRGNLGTIVLDTKPVFEDIDVLVRVTRRFDTSAEGETRTKLLEKVLPLKVRPNPEISVSADPSALVDHGASARLKISDTQGTARYRIYTRAIFDAEFVHNVVQPLPESDVAKASLPDGGEVLVRRPTGLATWPPEGFEPSGGFHKGTGGDLVIPLIRPVSEDTLVVVQAQKDDETSLENRSSVQLEQPGIVLVRPDPEQPLELRMPVRDGATAGAIDVRGGQPGVFYYFRIGDDEFPTAVYFHKRDERAPAENKGVGQLKIEVDLVVTPPLRSLEDRSETPPESPDLEMGDIGEDSTLHVRARKAQTGAQVVLSHSARVALGPTVRMRDPAVDPGEATEIEVVASSPAETYQLMLRGQPRGDPRTGTGDQMAFDSGAISEDTTFEILVSPSDRSPIVVERLIHVDVAVRPDRGVDVALANEIIDHRARAEVRVLPSQREVRYQLLIGGQAVGEALSGNDGELVLRSDPLTDSVRISVRATRIARPDVSVELDRSVDVAVRPDATLTVRAAATPIDHGTETTVLIETSQAGTRYQLMVGERVVGDAVDGDGSTVELKTGPLTQTTRFSVLAARIDNAEVSTRLDQQVTVQVRASQEG